MHRSGAVARLTKDRFESLHGKIANQRMGDKSQYELLLSLVGRSTRAHRSRSSGRKWAMMAADVASFGEKNSSSARLLST